MNEKKVSIVGQWKKIIQGGQSIWTFKSNGSFKHISTHSSGSASLSGTYTFDGKNLIANDPEAGSQAFIVSHLTNTEITIASVDAFREGRGGITYEKLSNQSSGSSSSGGSGGCYIATCVYGSYDCDEVKVLRNFRNTRLSKSVAGKKFINIYYYISPKLVKTFGRSKLFHMIFKPMCDWLVGIVRERA